MTRYTNLGLKRTHVEAGFNYRDDEALDGSESTNDPQEPAIATAAGAPTPILEAKEPSEGQDGTSVTKKKRKRSRKKRVQEGGGDEDGAAKTDGAGSPGPSGPDENNRKASTHPEAVDMASKKARATTKAAKGKQKMKDKRLKGVEARKAASEQRRLKRQELRHADTTCFACREKGHAARDCPKEIPLTDGGDTASARQSHKSTVGICYRCGSKKHTLGKCRALVDPEKPLPFASCFVCSGQGHLASSCPQNQAKGIYPNGGCCKLCGETTHLAKNCTLRKAEVATNTMFVGTGREAGADEDDFHTFKRRNFEVDKEEKGLDRRKRQANVRVGAHSGIVKPFGQVVPKPQKVVHF